ncbi:hypothetical protein ACOMHN_057190 [Nucella lapillus]
MDMETDCRNRDMAKHVLRQEVDRLTKRIERKFRPDAYKKSGLAGCRYIPKDERYKQFLRDYRMLDVQGLSKALRTVVEDPSHSDAALLEMPKNLVCLISLLARLGKYELTHATVNLVLTEVKSVAEKLRFWSRTLDKILNQMSPKWNKIPANDLDKVLSISVHKRKKIGFSLPQSKKPHTIEEAFVIGVWPGLELLYGREERSLSQSQLSKIMMIAAQNDCRDLFKDCVQRGADFCQILKITKFKNRFGHDPVFYARSPGRVNLIGEHIDYSGYAVLPMAIEQDFVFAVSPNSEGKIVLVNIKPEYKEFSVAVKDISISKTDPQWFNYAMCGVKGTLEQVGAPKVVGFNAVVEHPPQCRSVQLQCPGVLCCHHHESRQ